MSFSSVSNFTDAAGGFWHSMARLLSFCWVLKLSVMCNRFHKNVKKYFVQQKFHLETLLCFFLQKAVVSLKICWWPTGWNSVWRTQTLLCRITCRFMCTCRKNPRPRTHFCLYWLVSLEFLTVGCVWQHFCAKSFQGEAPGGSAVQAAWARCPHLCPPPPWTLSTTPGLCSPCRLGPPCVWCLRQSTKSLAGQLATRGNKCYSGRRTAVALNPASLVSLLGQLRGTSAEKSSAFAFKTLQRRDELPHCVWEFKFSLVCVCVCVCDYVCVFKVCVRWRLCVRACVWVCWHLYYFVLCVFFVCMCVCVCVSVYISACVREGLHAGVYTGWWVCLWQPLKQGVRVMLFLQCAPWLRRVPVASRASTFPTLCACVLPLNHIPMETPQSLVTVARRWQDVCGCVRVLLWVWMTLHVCPHEPKL